MPKRAQQRISWSAGQACYLLRTAAKEEAVPLAEDGEAWLRWLKEQRAFAFDGRNGPLNVLKEKRNRGSAGYWYAYQRQKAGMVKRYLGCEEQVTLQRLEEIAALMGREEGKVEQALSAQRQGDDVGSERLPSTMSEIELEPLLLPKLQLPRLQKGLLPRPQLMELLDSGLERKLMLIAGPAGYGKTTAVGQWIAARSGRADFPYVTSVTLDEGDNDPIRFWRYIIAACQKVQPGFGEEALKLLLAHRLPPFKPLATMLTTFLNDLSRLERSAILILDDLHVIRSSQVKETLSFFLEHLPDSLHLVMLIRGDPPFSLARLRARNELFDIHPPYLAFSLEETTAFFERELPFTLTPKMLKQIHERLDGWPAGLRLLTRELHWSDSTEEIERILSAFAGSYWSIQEYFLNEVLQTLPKETQVFLLETCILPRLTAPLCNSILEREDSAYQLATLRGGDLFLIPLDGTGEWSRYQQLFAEAMQQEARRCLGGERLEQIAIQASRWYEKYGMLSEAIEMALTAEEWTRATDLIKRSMEDKAQGRPLVAMEVYSLKRWVERLPEEELERNPDLCIHYAMILLFIIMEEVHAPGIRERIEHLLHVAEERWRDANKTAKLAEVFAFRALLARQEGKMLQALTWARQSLAWLPEEDRRWRMINLTVVGIGEIVDGQLSRAHEVLSDALSLSEQEGNYTYGRAIRGMLSWANWEQGELHQAVAQLRQMQLEARLQEDRDDIARTQLGLAGILYEWNELEQSEQAAQEALQIGEQMNEELQIQAILRLARVEYARGQTQRAQQRLMTWLARGPTSTTPYLKQLEREVRMLLVRIQLACGDEAAMEHWSMQAQRDEEGIPLLLRRREELLRARLLLARRDVVEALATLEKLEKDAKRTGHVSFRLEVLAVLVLASLQAGKQEQAHEYCHELLSRARSGGYIRLFLDEGEMMLRALRELLPQFREKALLTYGRHILSMSKRESDDGKTQQDTVLVEPLSPQEEKVLHLLAAGNANGEIARELVVSVNTIRTQVQSIYRKLNVNNRVEASRVARELGLA